MNIQKLRTGIIELKGILEEMKALLEWHKLRRFESTQRPSSNLQFHDTTLNDLDNKYASFLLLASQIHAELDSSNIPQDNYRITKKEFIKLELQAYYLGSDVRIY